MDLLMLSDGGSYIRHQLGAFRIFFTACLQCRPELASGEILISRVRVRVRVSVMVRVMVRRGMVRVRVKDRVRVRVCWCTQPVAPLLQASKDTAGL